MCFRSVETGSRINHRVMGGKDADVHRTHVCKVLTLMRKHKLYATSRNVYSLLAKYHFLGASWLNNGARPNPEKIKAITD